MIMFSCKKKLLKKLGSINTFINNHKKHTMATCFGGMGETPVGDPRDQECDNTSESESQEQILSSKYSMRQCISDNS